MTRATAAETRRYGFTDEGRRYVMRDVHLMDTAHTYLFNDTMVVDVEHRGRCGVMVQQPDRVQFAYKQACVYVRDEESGRFWSAPHDPVQAEPDEFEFSVGLGDVRWRVVHHGIEVSIGLMIPRDDMVELWTVKVRNLTRRQRHLSIYTFEPLEYGASMHIVGRFDAGLNGVLASHFPPYLTALDYYRLCEHRNHLFCAADRKPTAWEADLEAFIGPDGAANPRQLHDKRLGRGEAMNLTAAGIFQYVRRLAPGVGMKVNLICGPAQDLGEAKRLKRKYLAPGGMARAIKRVDTFLESHCPAVRIETPDADFNHFVNYWLPQETLFCGRTLRCSLEPCARNALQDAMGATYNDPQAARHWYQVVLAQQDRNGWLPHGIPLREGAVSGGINLIPHRDMNVWAPPALYFYLAETGDMSILDEKIRFRDDRTKATVYDHVCRGLDWLLKDRTKRKLSRIGQGDWNDPLDMAGPKGRGESVWLSEALVYALEVWADVSEEIGDTKRATRYRKEAGVSRQAINRLAWDGSWYVRGSTDAGKWFGTRRDKQGKLFLNAQSWALMCGAATGDRLHACIASVEKHLATPAGPMTIWPPYTQMRDDARLRRERLVLRPCRRVLRLRAVHRRRAGLGLAGYVQPTARANQPAGTSRSTAAVSAQQFQWPGGWKDSRPEQSLGQHRRMCVVLPHSGVYAPGRARRVRRAAAGSKTAEKMETRQGLAPVPRCRLRDHHRQEPPGAQYNRYVGRPAAKRHCRPVAEGRYAASRGRHRAGVISVHVTVYYAAVSCVRRLRFSVRG